MTVQFDDTVPGEAGEAVEVPLRTDAEGNPVYGDWPEKDYHPEPRAPEGGPEDPAQYNGYRDDDWGYEWSQTPRETPAEVQRQWDEFKRIAIAEQFDDDVLMTGVEKVYSTSQAANFFGKSNQWLYWGLRKNIFTYKDGSPIQPERAEGTLGKRRFTLPIIREIALSCYRRGNLREDDLHSIMAKILLEEFGEKAFANVGAESVS
jgi:hypothetical protein